MKNRVVYVSNQQNAQTNGSVKIVEPSEFEASIAEKPVTEWPTSPEEGSLCWHCCHTFNTPPIPAALHYDPKRDTFIVKGTFCSFGCSKAYVCGNPTPDSSNANTLFRKRWLGKLEGCVAAPPRQCLRAFGGTMSIEEFRQASENNVSYMVLPPKSVTQAIIVEQRSLCAQRHEFRREQKTLAKAAETISFSSEAKAVEPLKLRRPRKNGPVAAQAAQPTPGGMDAFLC